MSSVIKYWTDIAIDANCNEFIKQHLKMISETNNVDISSEHINAVLSKCIDAKNYEAFCYILESIDIKTVDVEHLLGNFVLLGCDGGRRMSLDASDDLMASDHQAMIGHAASILAAYRGFGVASRLLFDWG
jgi:hypothetical protein